jgi:hypothetical protein
MKEAVFRTVAAVLAVYGMMFGVGAVLLLKWETALAMTALTAVGWLGLRRTGTRDRRPARGA